MTDLDSTEIIAADESSSNIDTKASLKVVNGTDSDTFEINKESIIGRSSPSDFVIAAPSLSKQHAKITINNGQYFITDLGSSNKTFHNKIQLQPNVCYALHDGDEIKLGDVVCSFQEDKPTEVNETNPSTEVNNKSHEEEKAANESNDHSDEPSKQNGVNGSSHTATIDEDETAAPAVIEPKESDKDIQSEVVSPDETKKSLINETSSGSKDNDTDQATDSPGMVIDEKETENMDDEGESISDIDKSLTISEKVEDEESSAVATRGVARRNVRRARGRGRRGGAAARARVISTSIHGGRRNIILPPTTNNEENDKTLEETVSTEPEESPKKTISTPVEVKERKSKKNETTTTTPSQPTTDSNVRVSARIKERVSTGRNRQFPYTDDYVDLDNLEKQAKANSTTTTATPTGRKSNRGRPSASPDKRVSLRQQPIDASHTSEQKDNVNVYEDMDTGTETKVSMGRKRKSTPPATTSTAKRSRPATPQTVPTTNRGRKPATTTIEQSPTVAKPNRRTTGGQQQQAATTVTTPKRGRKSTKVATPTEQSSEKEDSTIDRPVRIALSSHLNVDPNHIDALRKLGFDIMDESCQVDALVVDRIRRTKKFFMCLARGAHILSPTWIETMIKENRYVSYDKYYLEDTNAETRYGFKLRDSVRLAKQARIFENLKFFCTKDTSPPYDDLKDIIEAAGGKLIDKINMNKPGKDIICIVGQTHKNEYEDLFHKGLSIVSEEFILSGISKQKLDFDSFSLFQKANTGK